MSGKALLYTAAVSLAVNIAYDRVKANGVPAIKTRP